MKQPRKIIAYIATSADGYIARRDGSVDWLASLNPADYGIAAFQRTIDTILWGRKTWDDVLAMGEKGGDYGARTKNYVFTHRPPKRPARGVEFVNEPVRTFVRKLRAAPGKHIWMMGGGKLIASFLDASAIDEFIIHVIPVFIGDGIPLIHPKRRTVPLALVSSRRYPDGVLRLHYRVAKSI